jgi:hypothetical protein
MYRVDLDKDHLLFLVYDYIRTFGKSVLVPEDPILPGHFSLRPEIAEEWCVL